MDDANTKDEERWATVMENLDLLFTKVGEVDKNQQRVEATIDMSTKVIEKMLRDQQLMAKQMEATGQAVAQLTLQHMRARDEQPVSPTFSKATVDNPFHRARPPDPRAPRGGAGRPPPPHRDHHGIRGFQRKISCPRFEGQNPCIWRAKCQDYFQLLNIPESMWTTIASLHMEGNVENWLQVHKLNHGLGTWEQFITAVQDKFGAFDYQHAIEEMLQLHQVESVEDYVSAFEASQFQISMHDQGIGDTYFISQFIQGLKPEIRYPVQGQAPDTMEKVVRLAKIHQGIQAKTKGKTGYSTRFSKTSASSTWKGDQKTQSTSPWSKERQLRDYCRANNLRFFCREPYDAGHAAKCSKRPKAQVNALCLNNLDLQLTDEVLAQLDMEDALAEEFGTLSLNAIARTEEGEAFRIRALVKNKVMLMLVDSGSSHSFISSDFLNTVGLQPTTASPKQVRVANGDTLLSTHCMPKMEWWTQGNTFTANMRVLDLKAYDAIIGYDWLKAHSPILHDWENRTMEFSHKDKMVMLKGVPPPDRSLTPLPVERLMKWLVGNDVWALAVVEAAPLISPEPTDQMLSEVQSLLDEFSDVFE